MIRINARGARTLADARPLIHDGQNVYVIFDGDTALLSIGGHFVDQRPAAELTAIVDAQDWAYEVIELVPGKAVADEEAEAEAVDPSAVYAAAVAQVRAEAAPLADEAARLSSLGEGPHSYRNGQGRRVTLPVSDPRHPARRAIMMRREFEVLATWTTEDEAAYSRYVSDGIGDTDGYYIPLDRFMWSQIH